MTHTIYGLSVIDDFRASKAPITPNGKPTFKPFKKGETIQGFKFNQGSTPANYIEVYKTQDGFIVPVSKVYPLGEVGQSEQKKKKIQPPKTSAVVIEDKPKKAKHSNAAGGEKQNLILGLKTKSKTATNGALIGVGLGVVAAMLLKKNKFMFGALGAVAGYAVGNMIAQNKDK